MIRYTLKGGSVVYATSAKNFLQKLRQCSRYPSHASDREFMMQFADRLETKHGCHIRFDNPGVFLADLLAHGLVSASR